MKLKKKKKRKKKKENNEMKSSAIKKPHVRPTHIHTRSHIRSKEPRKHTHTHTFHTRIQTMFFVTVSIWKFNICFEYLMSVTVFLWLSLLQTWWELSSLSSKQDEAVWQRADRLFLGLFYWYSINTDIYIFTYIHIHNVCIESKRSW